MAREILFKAKRIDNGEWVEGSLITGVFCRLGQDIPYIFCPSEADYDCFEDFSEENGIFEVQPDTICQYTGLTDKNGNKIWENDVVKVESGVMGSPFIFGMIGKVVYEECAFFIEPKDINETTYLFADECAEIEVIGNIFDNPELLGGAE